MLWLFYHSKNKLVSELGSTQVSQILPRGPLLASLPISHLISFLQMLLSAICWVIPAKQETSLFWETLKWDTILATEAVCEGRFLAWEVMGSRDSSRTLIMVPKVAIGPGSDRHQGQSLRQWPITSGIELHLVPPGPDIRIQPWGDGADTG